MEGRASPLDRFSIPTGMAFTGRFREIFPEDSLEVPCLLSEPGSSDEVFWGAAYNILVMLMKFV